MAVIKCKMCGGDMELTADKTFGTCEYCGSTMTLPKIDDDQRAAAFNRGNHFRRIGEFDKALAVYERIVREDDTDAEAHWCCALCRFGIEYVEDPATYEYLPTCHRASFDSFLEDVDYLAAVEHSDGITKRQYQRDGAKIAEVQRGILATSQNAEPYDVFICYKESDENGSRTRDSQLAQDIYYQLTEQGRKVFFARITLEDVVGTQYEPYIFAALNSAKVMVVVGTKAEYFNAVWVKNEWSRFLALMKKDRHKLLLPCYRDMDPYDMPEQLAVLQSYDMAKIGFIQDLTRGIAKVLDMGKKPEKISETVVMQQSSAVANVDSLLRRAFLFLEDEAWTSADEYCEKVLDIDPENPQAYLAKLMAECHVSRQENLREEQEPFDGSVNYRKVLRFADETLQSTLTGYIDFIKTRNEKARLDGIYNRATGMMTAAKTEADYKSAADLFETAGEYLDSVALAHNCKEKAEIARKNAILAEGEMKMAGNKVSDYEAAIQIFQSISGWKHADENIRKCFSRIEEMKAKEEIARLELEKIEKEKKKKAIIKVSVPCVIVAMIILLVTVFIPGRKYKNAKNLMEAGNYEEAYTIFRELGDFRDSRKQASMIQLKDAKVGDYVFFGAYEQDNVTSNGKEEIEWLVLDKKEDKVLVLSKYALDCRLYHDYRTAITWETCSIRTWLNSYFVKEAFSSAERSMIPLVTVPAQKSPNTTKNAGNPTEDQVFLLSIIEAEEYLSSSKERICQPTAYAKDRGAFTLWRNGKGNYVGKGNCAWWLRSPGHDQDAANTVGSDGDFYLSGDDVNLDRIGIRPAMWIKLSD